MNKIGRKLYFDIETGEVILDTGEKMGSVVATTVEKDIETYKALSERNRETFDVIELPYGFYNADFTACNSYRVNPETKELEFSYLDPNEPEVEQPYRAPLSVEVEDLKQRLITADEKYKELDKVNTPIADLRAAKIEQLKEQCTTAINAGFVSTVFRDEMQLEFGFNQNDQANFTQTMLLVIADSANAMTTIEWKSKNAGVVQLTKEEFMQIITAAKDHKLTEQNKYWQLEQQALQAITNEGVDEVVW